MKTCGVTYGIIAIHMWTWNIGRVADKKLDLLVCDLKPIPVDVNKSESLICEPTSDVRYDLVVVCYVSLNDSKWEFFILSPQAHYHEDIN